MYLPTSSETALAMMIGTMWCWGSWANTQKMTQHGRFALFYLDYAWGVLGGAVLLAWLWGMPESWANLQSVSARAVGFALGSGAVFNVANVLIVAAIGLSGMAVAFPVGIGLALVLGTVLSYLAQPVGQALWLFLGVGSVLLAMVCGAQAHRLKQRHRSGAIAGNLGVWLALCGGVLMGFFYPLLAQSMSMEEGLNAYSAMVVFGAGVLLGHLPVHAFLLRHPLDGPPLNKHAYGALSLRDHAIGCVGGGLWVLGTTLNVLASTLTGPAVAYAFGQGATLVAAFWGVVVWREFKGVPQTGLWLLSMFVLYALGLWFIGSAMI